MATIIRQNEGTYIYSEAGVTGIRKIADIDHEIVALTLDISAKGDPHQLPLDVTFCVIQGKGRIWIDDQPFEVISGDLVHVSAGTMRAWENVGENPLSVLVIKRLNSICD